MKLLTKEKRIVGAKTPFVGRRLGSHWEDDGTSGDQENPDQPVTFLGGAETSIKSWFVVLRASDSALGLLFLFLNTTRDWDSVNLAIRIVITIHSISTQSGARHLGT